MRSEAERSSKRGKDDIRDGGKGGGGRESRGQRMRNGQFYCSVNEQVLFKKFFNCTLFRRNSSKLENLKWKNCFNLN